MSFRGMSSNPKAIPTSLELHIRPLCRMLPSRTLRMTSQSVMTPMCRKVRARRNIVSKAALRRATTELPIRERIVYLKTFIPCPHSSSSVGTAFGVWICWLERNANGTHL